MLSVADAMALGCSLAWAVAVLLFRRASDVDPDALNLFKNTLASALLVVTLFATGGHFDLHRSARDWVLLVTSGVLGLAIADTLFLAGLRRVDASVVAICDCAYSPTVVLLGALVLREHIGVGVLLGAPLVVAGLLMVSWKTKRGMDRAPDRKGVALAVIGVITTAIGVVTAKPALASSALIEATTVRLLSGTTALFLFQIVTGRARRALRILVPNPAWKLLVPATFLGTYLAVIFWLGGMKYGLASRAALLNQTGAILVLVLSRFFGERIPRRRWLGAAVAIAGVFVVIAT